MSGPRIPVSRPNIAPAAAGAVARVLASGWITQGPEVAAFEREFAAFVGSPYACAVSSGTTALHLALLASGVRPGDEVVTVSHSFIASANAIRYCGGVPVFVDIDPGTLNIDPAQVASAITSRTRGILCVHQLGMPCDLPALTALAGEHNLPLVEDAACAIGSEIRGAEGWERIGRPHGDVACFSFHPRKLLTTGDGGMIATARADWDAAFRRWRQHGMDVPDSARHTAPTVTLERYTDLGYNYRLTDIQAAVGRTQLTTLPEYLKGRREQAMRYATLLKDIPGLVPPTERDGVRTNWQSYCVMLPDGYDQRVVMQAMLNRGIATRPGVMNAHEEPAYPPGTWRSAGHSGSSDGAKPGLPWSERARRRGLILPLFDALTPEEQAEVAHALRDALGPVRE